MKRFPWLLTLFTVPALAFLIGLGVWQVQRMHWKEGLIDQAELAATAPPAPIQSVLTETDPEFRKALIVCPGLPTAAFVELQSIHDGQAGSRLISLCRAPGVDTPFLIDRGFVADTVSARPRTAASTLPLSLLVELRRTPKAGGGMTPAASANRFYARDSVAIGRALGAERVSEFTLFALASTNPEFGALTASAPPAAFANNHFGYALTWFGLAIALVGFYLALARRQMTAKDQMSSKETS